MIKTLSAILLLFSIVFTEVLGQTKIACIGNSITELSGYPAALGKILGSGYKVTNAGKSGATLLYISDYPWIKVQGYYKYVVDLKPQIITIKLGTNDSKEGNWDKYKQNFVGDYNKLLDTLLNNIVPKPKIYICLPCPSTGTGGWINGTKIREEIIPKIKEVAAARNISVIDTYTPFLNKMNLFPDGIHPNTEGANEIAKIIAAAILKDNPTALFESDKTTQHLEIFPNPSTNELFIVSSTKSPIATYSISDLGGKEVQQGIAQFNTAINIESLPNGIYNVRLFESGVAVAYRKMTINR